MRWALPFLLLFSIRLGAAELINASVGQVGSRVVTARQVWISNFYDRWSLAKKGTDAKLRVPKADWRPDTKSDAFKQAASNLMLEVMVAQEAQNFSLTQIDEAKIESETNDFQKAMAGAAEWNRLEVESKEVQSLLAEKLRAQAFLKFKTESAGVVATDDEAKAYFEKNRAKFGRLPFAQFKESIKDVLNRQRLEDRLKDWFEVLKRKYRVRFLNTSES